MIIFFSSMFDISLLLYIRIAYSLIIAYSLLTSLSSVEPLSRLRLDIKGAFRIKIFLDFFLGNLQN